MRMTPAQIQLEAEIVSARIALEVGDEVAQAEAVAGATPMGDSRRLRGIPLFPSHGGICGTMTETDPEGECVRRSERRRWA